MGKKRKGKFCNYDFSDHNDGFAYLGVKGFCLFTSSFEGLDRDCWIIFTFQGHFLAHAQCLAVVLPKLINPLMLSVFLILLSLSLHFEW